MWESTTAKSSRRKLKLLVSDDAPADHSIGCSTGLGSVHQAVHARNTKLTHDQHGAGSLEILWHVMFVGMVISAIVQADKYVCVSSGN